MVRPSEFGFVTLLLIGAIGAPLGAGSPGNQAPAAMHPRDAPAAALAATRSLEDARASLGLGALDGFRIFNQASDASGTAWVRCRQTYRGVEVYNSRILCRIDASGRTELRHASVQAGISLPPADLVPEARIQEIALAHLPLQGKALSVTCGKVVFPTTFQDGLKAVREPSGKFVLDKAYSVTAPAPRDPFRWAYEVNVLQATGSGLAATGFIIDGLSGDILRKWDGMCHSSPAVGVGNSQYNGQVALDTEQEDSGDFVLRDTTRASQPNPSWFFPLWDGIGIHTFTWDKFNPDTNMDSEFTNTTDTWGDGKAFDWATDWPGNLLTPRSETAAVDAHYGICRTWDYFQNVLGRTGGIDGKGTSPVALVHVESQPGFPLVGAQWYTPGFFMSYGDAEQTGPSTSIDVTAHELAHGVMAFTGQIQEGSGEWGAVSEANSDVHGTMLKFYVWGAKGQGGNLPDLAPDGPGGADRWYPWKMGAQLTSDGSAQRYLYKPSLDNMSSDYWFDGIGNEDIHYACGPGNRVFYFLSQGASSDPASPAYSSFLPAGMKGLGNQKALMLWYNAMCNHIIDPRTDYQGFRKAMLESAYDLFGNAEIDAVHDAFAAVNLGAPVGGKEPVQVLFPRSRKDAYGFKVIPVAQPVQLSAPEVSNATDPSVVWSVGGLNAATLDGGEITPDGVFTAPAVSGGILWPVKAASKEDPREFAVEMVFGIGLDCDSDTEVDACDLGAAALAYGGVNVYPGANIYGSVDGCNDTCLELLLEGFRNAYGS
jgi:Zn-dependent metalloprotease